MKFQVIDLFCGAGGVTEGIQKAMFRKNMVHPLMPKAWFESLFATLLESSVYTRFVKIKILK